MISLKSIVPLLRGMNEFRLVYGGVAYPFDPADDMVMAAFGEFAVSKVEAIHLSEGENMNWFEIHIAAAPVRITA